MSQILLRAGRALRAFATAIKSKDMYGAQTHAVDMGWTPENLGELVQELKTVTACNHPNDKLTHLPIFNAVSAEVYLCQCGAVLDLADCRTEFGKRPLNADELQSLVADLVHLSAGEVLMQVDVALSTLQTAKERLGKVIQEMREELDGESEADNIQ